MDKSYCFSHGIQHVFKVLWPLACLSYDSVRNSLILSDGMAKEIPAVTFRVFIPITSPSCRSQYTHTPYKYIFTLTMPLWPFWPSACCPPSSSYQALKFPYMVISYCSCFLVSITCSLFPAFLCKLSLDIYTVTFLTDLLNCLSFCLTAAFVWCISVCLLYICV